MNIKDYLKLFSLNFKTTKLKSIIFIIIATLTLIIGNISINTSYILYDIINDLTTQTLQERKISVYNQEKSYEEEIKELLSLENIEYTYNTDYNSVSVDLNISPETTITLLPIYTTFSPQIITGREIETETELICPKYIKINNSNKVSDLINMENYLNKEITISYYSIYYYGSELDEITINNTYEKKVKIVGLYENYKGIDEGYNECFMQNNELIIMNKETQTTYSSAFLEKYDVSIGGRHTILYVNDINNIEETESQLISLGYVTNTQNYTLDTELLNNIIFFSRLGLFISVLLILIIIIFFINTFIKNQKYNIGIYKSFGYKNKQIYKIILLHITILFIISYIINIIILLCTTTIINNIMQAYITTRYININLSITRISIYIIFTTLLIYISSFTITSKINKLQIRDVLNENN